MSKLLLAIVHSLDAQHVIDALAGQGHRVTLVPSVGGFLRIENATLMIAAEDEAVPQILQTVKAHCSSRDIEMPLVVTGRLQDELPRTVRHGGATILIAELQSVVKI